MKLDDRIKRGIDPGARRDRPVDLGLRWIRGVGAALALAWLVQKFLSVTEPHYPVRQWLVWHYVTAWFWAFVFGVSCLVSGHALLRRTLGGTLPVVEHAALSFAIGVYLFFLGMFLGGLAHLYGPVFFVALPVALIAAGASDAMRTGRRLVRHIAHARRVSPRPTRAWAWIVALFGLLACLVVYVPILTPENIAFDSRWYHMAIAEHYAALGAVKPFPEGWYVGTSPHLASFLYTWAFLLPKSILFDHVELAAHVEFVVFVGSLVGIVALTRQLLPGAMRGDAAPPLLDARPLLARIGVTLPPRATGRPRAHLAWVVRFLFPGVFLYDSSLAAGADHVAAVFAAPAFLLLLRAWPRLEPRRCALLALVLAGAVLTKYTGAMMLVALPAIAIGIRLLVLGGVALYRVIRRREQEAGVARWFWIVGPAVALVAGLVFTAPHWAKNWVFYGNPLYPVMNARFPHLHPWTVDSAERYEWGFIKTALWQPEKDMHGLKESLKALLTFSYKPNDWPKFHGTVPVFGSLFTCLLFVLPFLRRTRRLWAVYASVELGVFVWYWTSHQDRYLQAMLPWMAAATAAAIVMLWRSNLPGRIGVAALVGVQIAWGGDVWAIPGHAMVRSPVKTVVDLVSGGYRKDKNRYKPFGSYPDIGAALPKGAMVLVHEIHPHLGIHAPSVNDYAVDQGGISWGRVASARKAWELLHGWGVTHMMWTATSRGIDTVGGDITFYDLAVRYGVDKKTYGSILVAKLPPSAPPDDPSDVTLVIACGGGMYKAGLYHLKEMVTPIYGPHNRAFPKPMREPPKGDDGRALVEEAEYVLVDGRCKQKPGASQMVGFTLGAHRRKDEIWIRTSGAPKAPGSASGGAEPTAPEAEHDTGEPETPPPREEPGEDGTD